MEGVVFVAVCLSLDFLHKITFQCGAAGGKFASVEGAGKILGESVVEEAAETGVVENVVLRIAIISEKDGIKLSSVLLCHPVDAIDVVK